MNKQNRNTHRENRLMAARGRGVGEMGEKMKRLRTINWQLRNSHRDIKYSIGNIVSNIAITMYGTRWVLEILGVTPSKVNDYPLCCIPEANTKQY